MTTKDIAEAVGKAEKTVRTWAAKAAAKSAEAGAKLAEAQKSGGRPADWTLEETCDIIETGMGKNAANLYRMSAGQVMPRNVADRVTCLETLIAAQIGMVDKLIGLVSSKVLSVPAQIEAPPLATRDELRRIVNRMGKASGDYSGAWNLLYQEVYYRMHRNVKECAKNRGMDTLDYIEGEDLLAEVVAIARELSA
jgi:hypothetical protein